MKVDKKDEYFAFQSKLIRRVCMNVITSIVVVVGLYLFIWKQRIGDLIVWILETVFDMKHEAAFYYYSDHFRGNKEIFFCCGRSSNIYSPHGTNFPVGYRLFQRGQSRDRVIAGRR